MIILVINRNSFNAAIVLSYEYIGLITFFMIEIYFFTVW